MIFFWVVVSIISGLYFVKAYSNPIFLILYVLFLAYIFKKFYGKKRNILLFSFIASLFLGFARLPINLLKNSANDFKLLNTINTTLYNILSIRRQSY